MVVTAENRREFCLRCVAFPHSTIKGSLHKKRATNHLEIREKPSPVLSLLSSVKDTLFVPFLT